MLAPESAETPNKKRKILTFEPCGPVSAMLENELKKVSTQKGARRRGSLRKVIQLAIVQTLGPKYPKLMQRFETLQEEQAD